MKNLKTIFAALVWFTASTASAQNRTLHVVLAADTLHPKKGFAQMCAADFAHVRDEVSEMAIAAKMTLRLYPVAGVNFLPDMLRTTVASVSVNPGDAMFCYISCNGFTDTADAECDTFRRLRFGRDTTRTLDTRELEKIILSKKAKPRLDIFIVDACALLRKVPAKKPRGEGPRTVYESLFAAQGCIRAFSSQCGEFSYGHSNGSHFTNCFIEALDHFISINFSNLTWRQVLDYAKACTAEKSATFHRPQHPVFFFQCDFKDKK